MRRLYVVTHPEATHHVDGLVGGWFDSRLTERGLRQADAVAKRLRELVPEDAECALWSSDLTRTAQTAAAVGAVLQVEPVILPGLREKSYGVAEGRPQAWLDERFVLPPAIGERMHHDEGVEGAETKHDFAVRVYAAVDQILQSPAQHQVVVTHGFALTFVVAAFTQLPLDGIAYFHLPATGGGITVLAEDDVFHNRSIVSLNETGHLAASG
ncbi:MAG: histidine phosphatase family protein [Motilibacteraceae bacterium]